MNHPVLFMREGERFIVEIPAISSWEGFDQLLGIIIDNHEAVLVKAIDGPDVRLRILEINGHLWMKSAVRRVDPYPPGG